MVLASAFNTSAKYNHYFISYKTPTEMVSQKGNFAPDTPAAALLYRRIAGIEPMCAVCTCPTYTYLCNLIHPLLKILHTTPSTWEKKQRTKASCPSDRILTRRLRNRRPERHATRGRRLIMFERVPT